MMHLDHNQRSVSIFLLTSIILLSYSGLGTFRIASTLQASNDIVTSNDECLPGSMVYCLNQQQPAHREEQNASSISSITAAQNQSLDNIASQGFLYVENAISVSVIDLATNAVIKNITVGKSPMT